MQLVHREQRDLRAQEARLVPRAQKVREARLVPRVQKVQEEKQVLRVRLARQEPLHRQLQLPMPPAQKML